MDISSVANQNMELMEIAYAVKCVKASQQSMMMTVGSIIEDTAEVSKEALELFRAEQKN